MHIDFTKPTVLTLTQYGTKVTIELDHSDTSIDELFNAFTTTLIGQGYLQSTINNWITDKADEIDEELEETIDDYFFNDGEGDDRMIEQYFENIAMDTNYGITTSEEEEYDDYGQKVVRYRATEEDMDEVELNEKYDYKGIHVENPWGNEPEEKVTFDWESNYDWQNEEEEVGLDEPIEDLVWPKPNEKLKMAAQRYSEEVKQKHTPIKIKEPKVLGKWQTDNKTKKIVTNEKKRKNK
jgi:hypothetical protein